MTVEEGGWLAAFLAALFAVLRAARAKITLTEAAEALVALVSWIWTTRRPPVVVDTTAIKPNPRLITISVHGTIELSEAGTALVAFAELVLSGVAPMTAAAECFGEIKVGVDGATKIPDEFRDYPEEAANTVGVIAARFIGLGAKQIAKNKAAKPGAV